jgi:hypothetical protein
LQEASASTDERIVHVYRLCLSRPPSSAERAAVTAFLDQARRRFERGDLDPEKVAGRPDAELAAWTVFARVLLNLDEMITKE